MKVCPECFDRPAPDQRDGSRRDGRCMPCRKRRKKKPVVDQYLEGEWWRS